MPLPGFSEPVEVRYEIVSGYAIYQGDINLGKVDEQGKLIKPEGLETQGLGLADPYGQKDHRWPDGLVTYRITGDWGAQTEMMKQRIKDAMRHWEDNTSIRFKEAFSSGQHAVDFVNMPGQCTAPVGYKYFSDDSPVSLGTECRVNEIIHELGHVVGYWHEHQRSDQEDYVVVYEDNVDDPDNVQWFPTSRI